jgi:hypothetical protein
VTKSNERAKALLKEAFRLYFDCSDGVFELRVQSAIRNIVGQLHDQAVACGCPADLSITLDLISQGLEDEIPDDLRKDYADVLDVHDVEPWVLPDFRSQLGR